MRVEAMEDRARWFDPRWASAQLRTLGVILSALLKSCVDRKTIALAARSAARRWFGTVSLALCSACD